MVRKHCPVKLRPVKRYLGIGTSGVKCVLYTITKTVNQSNLIEADKNIDTGTFHCNFMQTLIREKSDVPTQWERGASSLDTFLYPGLGFLCIFAHITNMRTYRFAS